MPPLGGLACCAASGPLARSSFEERVCLKSARRTLGNTFVAPRRGARVSGRNRPGRKAAAEPSRSRHGGFHEPACLKGPADADLERDVGSVTVSVTDQTYNVEQREHCLDAWSDGTVFWRSDAYPVLSGGRRGKPQQAVGSAS